MAAKSWSEKFDCEKSFKIKILDKKIADMPEGSVMLIASPPLIDGALRAIPYGKSMDTKTLRRDLAVAHGAEVTCPLTTGIFLRIVAEAALEKRAKGAAMAEITPFWRVIHPKSPLAGKLSCGRAFVAAQRKSEGISD